MRVHTSPFGGGGVCVTSNYVCNGVGVVFIKHTCSVCLSFGFTIVLHFVVNNSKPFEIGVYVCVAALYITYVAMTILSTN